MESTADNQIMTSFYYFARIGCASEESHQIYPKGPGGNSMNSFSFPKIIGSIKSLNLGLSLKTFANRSLKGLENELVPQLKINKIMALHIQPNLWTITKSMLRLTNSPHFELKIKFGFNPNYRHRNLLTCWTERSSSYSEDAWNSALVMGWARAIGTWNRPLSAQIDGRVFSPLRWQEVGFAARCSAYVCLSTLPGS